MKKLKLNIQLFGGSLSITASETDISIDNNQSYIDLTIKATTNSTTYNDSAYLKSATITGQNNTYTLGRINFKIGKGQTVTVYSGKIGPFDHNADGTLNPVSISASAYIVSNTQPTASATVTMSTIPRASSISVADANIGSSTNITINKASSSFTTTLWYKAQGQNSWTKIVDKTSNQVYGWTVPTSFYSIIPSAKTMTCQFYADTYSGSTLVGSSSTVTATFTATGNPIISSFTLQSTDSTTVNLVGSNRMIRYISTIQATTTSSGQNSATISSVKINGVTATNGIVNFANASTYSYTAVVTDTRGYQTSQTVGITWTDYIPLTLSASITRNQPTDGKVNINVSGNYFNSSFRKSDDTYIANTLSVQYRYKERSSSTWGSWTTLSTTLSGNTYSGTTQLSDFDYTKIYDFEAKATDRVSTKSISGITVTKGTPVFNWDNDEFDVNVDTTMKQLTLDGINMNNFSGKRINNVDLNNYGDTGFYYFGTGCSNTPNGNYYGVYTINGGTNDKVQLGCGTSTQEVYWRRKSSANWDSWKPISTIISKGSNSNGNYIQYSDGTLIQWDTIETTNQAISSQYGNTALYFGTRNITFPVAFLSDSYPNVVCGQFKWGTSGSWGSVSTVNGTTGATLIGYDFFSRSTGTKCYIMWSAIGKWK